MRFVRFGVLLFSCLLSVQAPVGAEEVEKKVEAANSSNLAYATKELLEKRFLARWDAFIKGDFEAAYTFESAAYKEAVDFEGYKKSYHPNLTWSSVKVDEVKIEEESKAVVSYRLSFTFKTEWDVVLESTDFHTEEWFFENGEWWHDKKSSVSPYSVLNQK